MQRHQCGNSFAMNVRACHFFFLFAIIIKINWLACVCLGLIGYIQGAEEAKSQLDL